MPNIDFNVEAVEQIKLTGVGALQNRDLMSPYVWQEKNGSYAMLVRVVPHMQEGQRNTGSIWLGHSADGLNFEMDQFPVLAPERGGLDEGGCEDPTVVFANDEYYVFYTGVDASMASGQMLYACGSDMHSLVKQGIALPASCSEGNTKEATFDCCQDGRWRLFYEFARDNQSLIGLAASNKITGPWTEHSNLIDPRPDSWDNYHLSTGPMLTTDPEMPVMFYNGATIDARWRIGWVAFDANYENVVDRCIQPLLSPPPQLKRAAADIAFAASVIAEDSDIYLYYSLADRTLERALIRKSSF